jgi:hypothetical protein
MDFFSYGRFSIFDLLMKREYVDCKEHFMTRWRDKRSLCTVIFKIQRKR